MNTMPQTFDARPHARVARPLPGYAVPGLAAARKTGGPHLKLVGSNLLGAGTAAASMAAPAAAYDLSVRRHLASVPARSPARPAAASGAQAASRNADNASSAAPPPRSPSRLPLEPLVFALVLLVSVAALAVAMRAT